MSAYRVPVHTAAGGFATLIVLAPWEICLAAGMHEESAAWVCAALLLVMACGAFGLGRTVSAERSYSLTFLDEEFRLRRFLLAFALFALLEIALAAVVAFLYLASPQR